MKVLVFGDSVSWGAFDLDSGGWVERLKIKYLRTYNEGKGVGFYNLSVSSNNTKGLINSIEKDIDKFNYIEPEDYIFIFSIGLNDCCYVDSKKDFSISLDEYENNLKTIINLAKKYTNKIVFLGLTMVDESKTNPWIKDEYWENDDLKKYNNVLKSICFHYSVGFIKMENVICKDDLFDGLHPNNHGHKKIFNFVDKYLLKNYQI